MYDLYRLSWLPKKLPPFINILLTTLPDEEVGCLSVLQRFLPEENIIEISEMTLESGKEILTTMLSRAGRQVTEIQMSRVMEGFQGAQTPLYLKVMLVQL